jgi:hypothetical protein
MAAEMLDTVPAGSAVKKPLYEGSTQYKNWRFSPEKLAYIRAALNAAAVSVIRNTFEADEVCGPYSFITSLRNQSISQGRRQKSSFWLPTRNTSLSSCISAKYLSYAVTSVSQRRLKRQLSAT